MLPVPAATFSLKFSTMLLPTATALLLSVGLAEAKVGTVVSCFDVIVSLQSIDSSGQAKKGPGPQATGPKVR
jgi:hypothetical protein